MVIGITYKNQKLIFQEGDKERARTLLKDSGITPEDVKDWFKAEYNNPCCLEPQLELRLLEDLRIAFFCKNCQSWRFREKLSNIKQKDNFPKKEKQSNDVPEGISLNRRCINCGSDNWLILKPDSATSAIQCLNCDHVELHANQRPKKKVWWK